MKTLQKIFMALRITTKLLSVVFSNFSVHENNWNGLLKYKSLDIPTSSFRINISYEVEVENLHS